VLVVAESHDRSALRLVAMLEQHGCSTRTLDASSFPTALTVSYRKSAAAPGTAGLDHDVVLFRQTRRSRGPETWADAVARYAAAESYRFLHDLWATLQTAWFPAPPAVILRAQNKLLQLELAADLGLPTPATLVTNDPDEVIVFWRSHGGRVISKAPSEVFHAIFGEQRSRYTEPVSLRDLHHADCVRGAPTLFQALVPKRRELRVTVVDGEVFPAAIYSQESRRTRIDWRRYDHDTTRLERVELPADVARACTEMTRRLGVRYGAIDLIETPDGELVFLEINPAGQWGWIEEACDLPITAAIADAVATTAHRRRCEHG
jgi:glutathione synthase/RimK-type ligase-like ATP-grasp enzyme